MRLMRRRQSSATHGPNSLLVHVAGFDTGCDDRDVRGNRRSRAVRSDFLIVFPFLGPEYVVGGRGGGRCRIAD